MANQSVQLIGNGRIIFAPYVKVEDRLGFESYVSDNIYAQIQEYMDYMETGENATEVEGLYKQILALDMETKGRSIEPYEGPDVKSEYLVLWQSVGHSPPPYTTFCPRLPHTFHDICFLKSAFGSIYTMNNIICNPAVLSMFIHVQHTKRAKLGFVDARAGVSAQIIQPVFQDVFPESQASKREVMGVLWMTLGWDGFFMNILPEKSNGIRVVMESSCGFVATYEINGLQADFLGLSDVHDSKYDYLEIATEFFSLGEEDENFPSELCMDQLTVRLYPTDTLRDSTTTSQPIVYSVAVAGIFLFTSSVFLIYDLAVRRRQNKVMARVITQDKIVSNLFPATIRDRLYGIGDRMNGGSDGHSTSTGASAKDLLDLNEVKSSAVYGKKPIADLFLETVSPSIGSGGEINRTLRFLIFVLP